MRILAYAFFIAYFGFVAILLLPFKKDDRPNQIITSTELRAQRAKAEQERRDMMPVNNKDCFNKMSPDQQIRRINEVLSTPNAPEDGEINGRR